MPCAVYPGHHLFKSMGTRFRIVGELGHLGLDFQGGERCTEFMGCICRKPPFILSDMFQALKELV